MRLFIAVLFTPELIAELTGAVERLRRSAESGRFSYPENLHLTLAFLGETDRADAAARVMGEAASEPFTLTLSGCGRFRRAGGDIVWAGLAENRALSDYAERLADGLRRDGFTVEYRKFSPHITLGREVVTSGPLRFDINPLSMECRRISLMKSERINGRQIYTEIRAKNL